MGVNAVWNFSENSSHLVAWPLPYYVHICIAVTTGICITKELERGHWRHWWWRCQALVNHPLRHTIWYSSNGNAFLHFDGNGKIWMADTKPKMTILYTEIFSSTDPGLAPQLMPKWRKQYLCERASGRGQNWIVQMKEVNCVAPPWRTPSLKSLCLTK